MPGDFILTVHDLIQFKFSREGANAIKAPLARIILQRAARKAREIVCVSEFTRQSLLTMDPALEDKTHVIPNGISTFWRQIGSAACNEFKRRFGLDNFLLAVGNKAKHKNFDFLLKIFERVAPNHRNLRLVIVGRRTDEWCRLLNDWKASSSFSDRVLDLDRVSDEELRNFYSCADAFLMPSLCEGFGIPPLEAMSSATPVISSSCGGLPEAVGEAGVLLDPTKPELWKEAIEKMLSCQETRDFYIEKGINRSREFQWDQISPILEELMAKGLHNDS